MTTTTKPKKRPGARTKAAAKKGPAGKQKPIPGMEDEFKVPKPVQKAADAYNESLLEKGRANAKFNSDKDRLIEALKDAGLPKVRVLKEGGGFRIFELTTTDKIKAKVDKAPEDED